jgi:hypothetical protein
MVMFAWTRTKDNIIFADGVTELIYVRSNELSTKYVPQPPLVQASNFDAKLARMCVALATMLYSTDETGENVIVKAAHVDYITQYIQELYDNEYFGYGDVSEKRRDFIALGAASTDFVVDYLRDNLSEKNLRGLPTGQEALRMFDSINGGMTAKSLGDMLGGTSDDGNKLINFMVDNGMMERSGAEFVKFSAAMNKIMKGLRRGDHE